MTKLPSGGRTMPQRQTLSGPDGEIEILETRPLWTGFIRLSEVTVRLPAHNGGQIEMQHLVHDHGNAVVVLPVDYNRRTVLLIRQWRVPAILNGYPQRLLETIAGLKDRDESAEDCARREAMEETGYEISGLTQIGDLFASPGTLTERFVLFLAEYGPDGKRQDGGGLAAESEDIEVVEMPIATALELLDEGGIHDAKTAISLLHLRQHLAKRDGMQVNESV